MAASFWNTRRRYLGEGQDRDRLLARSKHELLLIGTRGNVPAPAPGKQWQSVISASVGRHSEKPYIFHEMIERLFPSMPKIELFARGPGSSRLGGLGLGIEPVTVAQRRSSPYAAKSPRSTKASPRAGRAASVAHAGARGRLDAGAPAGSGEPG